MSRQLQLFAQPESVLSLSPERLRRLCQSFGFVPPVDLEHVTDVKEIAKGLLAFDHHAPRELVSTLITIAELSSWDVADALATGIPEGAGDQLSPADIVAEVWFQQPERLERERARRRAQRLRKFEYFQALPNAPESFRAPSEEGLQQLTAILKSSFTLRKRGGGVRIWSYEEADALWFLIWHGGAFKHDREWENEKMNPVGYQPAINDVVVYDLVSRELRINSQTEWQTQLYRCAFGTLLFGNSRYFPGTNKYTLRPLELDLRAALVCSDVPGMERVMLRQLEFVHPGPNPRVTLDKAENLIESLDFRIPRDCRPLSATFGLKFRGQSLIKSLAISPSNVVHYTPDENSELVEQWIRLRGYIRGETHHDGDNIDEVLDVA
jgi:hypothetical protein